MEQKVWKMQSVKEIIKEKSEHESDYIKWQWFCLDTLPFHS